MSGNTRNEWWSSVYLKDYLPILHQMVILLYGLGECCSWTQVQSVSLHGDCTFQLVQSTTQLHTYGGSGNFRWDEFNVIRTNFNLE